MNDTIFTVIVISGSILVAFMAVFWNEIMGKIRKKKHKVLPAKDPMDDEPNPGFYND